MPTNDSTSPSMSGNPSRALVLGQKELYRTSLFSDLTISCRGREFKVHKYALYTQSSVWRRLLTGSFKEATTQQRVIPIDDDDPEVLEQFLFYIYNFHLGDLLSRDHESVSAFIVKLYAIADKYDVTPLRDTAALKLNSVCDPVKNPADAIATLWAIEEHTRADDPTLWQIIIPKIKNNITSLLALEEFRQLIQDMPDLNFRLLAQLDPLTSAQPSLSSASLEHDSVSLANGDADDDGGLRSVQQGYSTSGRYRGQGRRLGSAV